MEKINGARDDSRYSIPSPVTTAGSPALAASNPASAPAAAAVPGHADPSTIAGHSRALSFPLATPPAPGAAAEVAPGVFWLRMPLPFALDHINLWLIRDGDRWTQVDSGYGDQTTRDLWQTHFETTLQGAPLRQIVVTHYHPDHLGNAEWLRGRFHCELAMPVSEFLTAHAISGEHSGYGVRRTSALFRRHGMSQADVDALEARGNLYRRGVPELPWHCRQLVAGDEVRTDGRRWRVIVGYGHSPEHASLHCRELGVLISGDMLLPRISTNVSVWPADPDGDPLARFLSSLEAFLELPDDTLVLPSHGFPFRGIAHRVGELRAHHAARLSELEAAATTPVNAAAILPVLFRRPLDLQQRFFAMGEAIAHLNHLWHQGRLDRTEGEDATLRFARRSSR